MVSASKAIEELWQQADMSVRHWDFIAESLVELRENLKRCGQPLVVRTGDVDVLDELREVVLSRVCGHIRKQVATGPTREI